MLCQVRLTLTLLVHSTDSRENAQPTLQTNTGSAWQPSCKCVCRVIIMALEAQMPGPYVLLRGLCFFSHMPIYPGQGLRGAPAWIDRSLCEAHKRNQLGNVS